MGASKRVQSIGFSMIDHPASHHARYGLFWTDQYLLWVAYHHCTVLTIGSCWNGGTRALRVQSYLPKISAYLRADPFRNWSQQVQGLSALSRVDSRRSQTLPRALLYSASFF
jgi:hypothetical protein